MNTGLNIDLLSDAIDNLGHEQLERYNRTKEALNAKTRKYYSGYRRLMITAACLIFALVLVSSVFSVLDSTDNNEIPDMTVVMPETLIPMGLPGALGEVSTGDFFGAYYYGDTLPGNNTKTYKKENVNDKRFNIFNKTFTAKYEESVEYISTKTNVDIYKCEHRKGYLLFYCDTNSSELLSFYDLRPIADSFPAPGINENSTEADFIESAKAVMTTFVSIDGFKTRVNINNNLITVHFYKEIGNCEIGDTMFVTFVDSGQIATIDMSYNEELYKPYLDINLNKADIEKVLHGKIIYLYLAVDNNELWAIGDAECEGYDHNPVEFVVKLAELVPTDSLTKAVTSAVSTEKIYDTEPSNPSVTGFIP